MTGGLCIAAGLCMQRQGSQGGFAWTIRSATPTKEVAMKRHRQRSDGCGRAY